MSLLEDLEEDLESKRSLQRRSKQKSQTLYTCTKCGRSMGANSFRKNAFCSSGIRSICRECDRNRYSYEEQQVITWNSRARFFRVEGRISLNLWLDLKAAYNGRCAYCGLETDNLSPDHYYPVSWARQAGFRSSLTTGWIDNCRPCCRQCNMAKGDSDPIEFIKWLDGVAARRNDLRRQEDGTIIPTAGAEEPQRAESAA